jgi:hypothetical protein
MTEIEIFKKFGAVIFTLSGEKPYTANRAPITIGLGATKSKVEKDQKEAKSYGILTKIIKNDKDRYYLYIYMPIAQPATSLFKQVDGVQYELYQKIPYKVKNGDVYNIGGGASKELATKDRDKLKKSGYTAKIFKGTNDKFFVYRKG